MELAIFSKKRTTNEGKSFYTYLTQLTKKDGTSHTVSVRFRDECGAPKPDLCPMNIIVEKEHMNLSTKEFCREDTGEMALSYNLWVSKWEEGSTYIDNSLDDYLV